MAKKKKYPRKIQIGKHLYDVSCAKAEKDLREQFKAHRTGKYWKLW